MKRIYLALLLLCVTIVAYSQDLNEDQKDLRQKIIDKLDQMSLKPEIDIDGTVFFQKEGKELYVSVDPEVTSRPFLISMYYGSSYDSGANARVTRSNLEKALPVLNSELSRVKVITEEAYYLVSSEMYAASPAAVEKMIEDISSAVEKINSEYLDGVVEKFEEERMEAARIKNDATVSALTVGVPVLQDSIKSVLGCDTVKFKMILVKDFNDTIAGNDYDYRIGETEVTQRLWLAVMGYNNSGHKQSRFKKRKFENDDPDLPVENVTYSEVDEFLEKLNEMTSDKYNFRLPNKAEWIFAAKGGDKDSKYLYSGSDKCGSVAVYRVGDTVGNTQYVRSKKPNELGIYDMSGNVYEWCSDGPDNSPEKRFVAGGCYKTGEDTCGVEAVSDKSVSKPQVYVGFRLVMDVKL